MQQRKSQNAKDILERLKIAYNIKNDTELAAFLGVARNTVSTWKTRNSIDYALVFARCDNLNIDWLITGEGEIFKTKTPKNVVNQKDDIYDDNFDDKRKLQKTSSNTPPLNENNSPTETDSDSEVIREQKNVFTGMTDTQIEDILTSMFRDRLLEMYETGRAAPAVEVRRYQKRIEELSAQVARLEFQINELQMQLTVVRQKKTTKRNELQDDTK